MPQDSVQQQIQKRFAELPKDIQDAVTSSQVGEHIRAIGTAHNLHIDQVGQLEDEVMLVMLGFFEPAKFSEQLQQQLSISAADAEGIAKDVGEQIFAPIRASLEQFSAAKHSGAPLQPAAPMTSSAPATPVPAEPVAKTPATPATSAPEIKITPDAPAIAATPTAKSAPATPSAPMSPQIPASAPKPALPAMPEAEKLLTQKTVVAAPPPAASSASLSQTQPSAQTPAPAQPQGYKVDPYREPIE